MKRKILFIVIFAVATIAFIGCGKKEETPVISNNVETETTMENEVTITEEVEEPTENIIEEETTEEPIEPTETDQTIEVDITGVDGTVEEGDYDEEIHSENAVPTEETDEFQQMLEEMAQEIYNSNGSGNSHIAADPSSREALGMIPATDEVRNPDYHHGQTELSEDLQGQVTFE